MRLNPYIASYEVLSKTGFNVDSHGSVETTAPYLIQNDIPDYARHFYHPSEHEIFTSIKYGNFEVGYHGLNEIRESMNGMPFEFCIPSGGSFDPGVGRQDMTSEPAIPRLAEIVSREAASEIKKAQEEIRLQRRRTVTVEETILLKRKRSIMIEEEFQ